MWMVDLSSQYWMALFTETRARVKRESKAKQTREPWETKSTGAMALSIISICRTIPINWNWIQQSVPLLRSPFISSTTSLHPMVSCYISHDSHWACCCSKDCRPGSSSVPSIILLSILSLLSPEIRRVNKLFLPRTSCCCWLLLQRFSRLEGVLFFVRQRGVSHCLESIWSAAEFRRKPKDLLEGTTYHEIPIYQHLIQYIQKDRVGMIIILLL